MARFVVQNCIYPYIFYMGSLFLQQPYSADSQMGTKAKILQQYAKSPHDRKPDFTLLQIPLLKRGRKAPCHILKI